jgi:hypothetical protein
MLFKSSNPLFVVGCDGKIKMFDKTIMRKVGRPQLRLLINVTQWRIRIQVSALSDVVRKLHAELQGRGPRTP